MALTEKELQLIEHGLRLAVAAVLAAVRAAGTDSPIDWDAVRITETPEMARERAKNQRSGIRTSEVKEAKETKDAKDSSASAVSSASSASRT